LGGKMGDFNQSDFNSFVLDNGIIGFFEKPITLKSGRLSNWYVNWRNVAEDAFLTDKLVDFVLAFAKDNSLDVDCFYGVPEGATKLGILTQFKFAQQSGNYGKGSHILAMGRAKPKEHGAPKDKFFVGMPNGKTIILEDVTTTGGSLLTTIDKLKEANVQVVAAIGLTNRMSLRDDGKSVKQAVEEKAVPYYQLSSALDLLPEMFKRNNTPDDFIESIKKEFEENGVEKLELTD